MSQVPTHGNSNDTQLTYQVLDAQGGLTPLSQLLRCAIEPDDASASLILRNPQDGILTSVAVVTISTIDHDRVSGGIFFEGITEAGCQIEGIVYSSPQQDKDPEVLGMATITYE